MGGSSSIPLLDGSCRLIEQEDCICQLDKICQAVGLASYIAQQYIDLLPEKIKNTLKIIWTCKTNLFKQSFYYPVKPKQVLLMSNLPGIARPEERGLVHTSHYALEPYTAFSQLCLKNLIYLTLLRLFDTIVTTASF